MSMYQQHLADQQLEIDRRKQSNTENRQTTNSNLSVAFLQANSNENQAEDQYNRNSTVATLTSQRLATLPTTTVPVRSDSSNSAMRIYTPSKTLDTASSTNSSAFMPTNRIFLQKGGAAASANDETTESPKKLKKTGTGGIASYGGHATPNNHHKIVQLGTSRQPPLKPVVTITNDGDQMTASLSLLSAAVNPNGYG